MEERKRRRDVFMTEPLLRLMARKRSGIPEPQSSGDRPGRGCARGRGIYVNRKAVTNPQDNPGDAILPRPVPAESRACRPVSFEESVATFDIEALAGIYVGATSRILENRGPRTGQLNESVQEPPSDRDRARSSWARSEKARRELAQRRESRGNTSTTSDGERELASENPRPQQPVESRGFLDRLLARIEGRRCSFNS